jgi:hypothetical protein
MATLSDQADPLTTAALSKVDAYIAAHPEYTRQGVPQPGQGSTNRVVFCRLGEATVVFKVFCQRERKQREIFAFHHWQHTGLIPALVDDVDETMLVMAHLPGVYLHQSRQEEPAPLFYRASYATGHAIGTLSRVPLSTADRATFESRFYGDTGPLEAYLGRIAELGRSIQARDPDFQDAFWRDNLDVIECQLSYLYARPRILYHQDVSNLHVLNGRFVGFLDLEMCRVGCAAMQVASALNMLNGEQTAWEPFRAGWEAATGEPLGLERRQATLAAYSLLQWREISRYMSYDGTPGTGYTWASPADPARTRALIQAAQTILNINPN